MDDIISVSEADALVESNIGFVKWVINRHFKTNESIVGLGFDDMLQEGCIWLIHAARTYDNHRSEFSTYACTVVRNGLYSYCRKLLSRPEIFVSLDDLQNPASRKAMEYDDVDERIAGIDALSLLDSVKPSYDGIAGLGIEAIKLKVMGYSNIEIAKLIGAKQNHVAAWISRASRKLKNDARFMKGVGRNI